MAAGPGLSQLTPCSTHCSRGPPNPEPSPWGGSSCWEPPGMDSPGERPQRDCLCVCPPRPVRLLALVPAFTRVCVSPARPPGSDCLTRPPCCSCRARRLFPLPNLARAGGCEAGGAARGLQGGSPRSALPEMTSKRARGARRGTRHRRNLSGFRSRPASSAARLLRGVQGPAGPPQPHTGPPGCSPREELFASHRVCGLLSAPRWSGLCRDVAEGARGAAPAPSPNSSSTAQRPMRTHPAPRVPGGDSVTASVSQRSSGGVPAHSVPPQPPTPQTLPPAGLKFPPGDAGAGRKRVPWVGWC